MGQSVSHGLVDNLWGEGCVITDYFVDFLVEIKQVKEPRDEGEAASTSSGSFVYGRW